MIGQFLPLNFPVDPNRAKLDVVQCDIEPMQLIERNCGQHLAKIFNICFVCVRKGRYHQCRVFIGKMKLLIADRLAAGSHRQHAIGRRFAPKTTQDGSAIDRSDQSCSPIVDQLTDQFRQPRVARKGILAIEPRLLMQAK